MVKEITVRNQNELWWVATMSQILYYVNPFNKIINRKHVRQIDILSNYHLIDNNHDFFNACLFICVIFMWTPYERHISYRK